MTIRSTLGAAGVLVIGGMLGCAANSDYIYQPDTANATAASRFHAGGAHVVHR